MINVRIVMWVIIEDNHFQKVSVAYQKSILSDLNLSQAKLGQDFMLRLPHTSFCARLCMVMAQQMQDAMYNQKLQLRFQRMTGFSGAFGRIRYRDEKIAKVTHTSFRVGFGPVRFRSR